jgi:hypothetical protein
VSPIWLRPHPIEAVDPTGCRPMGDFDALCRPGGTRGVENSGEIIRPYRAPGGFEVKRARSRGREQRRLPAHRLIEREHVLDIRQTSAQARLHQQCDRFAVV